MSTQDNTPIDYSEQVVAAEGEVFRLVGGIELVKQVLLQVAEVGEAEVVVDVHCR